MKRYSALVIFTKKDGLAEKNHIRINGFVYVVSRHNGFREKHLREP